MSNSYFDGRQQSTGYLGHVEPKPKKYRAKKKKGKKVKKKPVQEKPRYYF